MLFALGLVCALAWWQTSAARDARPDVNLRAETTLVVIPVTVTDASNRYVLGLGKDNFSILEDGVKQKISQFAAEEAPLSIGLLVDTSGSMGAKLGTSRQAAAEILNTMSAEDEAFLVEFSDKAQLAVPFTARRVDIDEKLASAESTGLTALLDAVEMGLQEMKHAKNARKALVLISDGGDNNSRYKPEEIQKLVREADIQVYCMGVFEPFSTLGLGAAELSGPRLLTEIAEQTGGRAYPARSFAALPTIARKIAIELRNQYVLAYTPSRQEHDGKYHKVDVKLSAPPGLPALKAHWRLGYYALAQ